jgi:hypothetical protein
MSSLPHGSQFGLPINFFIARNEVNLVLKQKAHKLEMLPVGGLSDYIGS